MQKVLGVVGVVFSLVACTSTTKVDRDNDVTTGAAGAESTNGTGDAGDVGGATSSSTSDQSSATGTGGLGLSGTGGEDGGTGGEGTDTGGTAGTGGSGGTAGTGGSGGTAGTGGSGGTAGTGGSGGTAGTGGSGGTGTTGSGGTAGTGGSGGTAGTGGSGGTGTTGTTGTGGGPPVPTCDTHGEECDSNASCSNTDVGIECTCAPGYEDVTGDGHECVDKCTVANCSADANCRIVDGDAECTCKAGFSGDGETCTADPDCASLGCSALAQCIEVASTLTCVCPAGFDDDGVGADGCTNCAADFDLVDDYCIDEQLVNCVDDSPPNASPSVVSVTITYADGSGWSTPADCDWECLADFALEGGSCIDSKQVACVDNAPNNAVSTPANTTITYTDAGGWSTPANCAWNCNPGYDRQSGQCVSECLTDNGGCDPLTTCSLDPEGVVCGDCPENYEGSGETECTPVPRCDPSEPFVTAQAVTPVNLSDEVEFAMLSKDGLSMYVQYLDSPEVYRATRDNLYVDFGSPSVVTYFDSIISTYPDAQLLSMTANGLTLYFHSGFFPFEATRSNTTQAFGSIVERTELQNSSGLPLSGLWVTPSGGRIYGFVLINYYLATAIRTGGSFGSLTTLATTPSSDYALTLSSDERTMYWTVTGGDPTDGSGDIWRAHRSSTATGFSDEEFFGAVNGSLWDEPIWVSDDDCELYLQRRNAGLGSWDPVAGDGIFVARRPF